MAKNKNKKTKKGAKKSAASTKISPSKKAVFPIQPLLDRVLLKPIDEQADRTTDSGIFLPANVKEDKGAKMAKVVAVGAGRTEDGILVPVSVHVGATVLYSWGDSITHDGVEYVLVREHDILAILN